MLLRQPQRQLPAIGFEHRVARGIEQHGHQPPDRGIVLNEEHRALIHGFVPALRALLIPRARYESI